MQIGWNQALTWRLQRHFLHRATEGDVVEIVRRLCGVQAQVLDAARLGIAVRQQAPAPDGRDVTEAITGNQLLRTWAMRGTLHLMPADVLPSYLALLAAARTWERGSWQRTFADAPTMDQLAELVPAVLDGPPLSREELVTAVTDRTRNGELAERLRSGWSTLLKPLSWQGLLCQGPPDGNRVTFTRPDRCVPGWPGLPDPDTAASTVLRAYLGAHGPATPEAFDRWLLRGTSRRADLARWFAALGSDVVEVDVEGRRSYLLAEHADLLATVRPAHDVHLLPAFDQFVLGPGTDDPAVVPAAHRGQVSRAGGLIAPVLLIGGRVSGTWEWQHGEIVVTPFQNAPPADPDLLARQLQHLEELAYNNLRY